MKLKGLFILLTIIIFLQFTSAINTEIKISAPSNHDLKLTFINPDAAINGEKITLETKKINTKEDIEIITTFKTNKKVFNLAYYLTNNGTKILSGTIKDITAGETLYLLLIPGAIKITKNYTEPLIEEILVIKEINNFSENDLENSSEIISGEFIKNSEKNISKLNKGFFNKFETSIFLKIFRISGFVSSNPEKTSFNKFFYYLIGFILFFIILFFIIKMKNKKENGNKKFKNNEEELKDDEKKIQEAQDEIKEVRGKKIGILD
jgi:large-conductance mechanosensitive channel